jgi:hypothetical protein
MGMHAGTITIHMDCALELNLKKSNSLTMQKQYYYLLIGILFFFTLFSCSNNTNRNSGNKEITLNETPESEKPDIKDNKSEIFNCDYLGEKPPTEEPVRFAPEIFSAGCFEISVTGKEMQFTRSGNIYLMSKTDSGWDKPYVAPFSGRKVDGESTYLPNGRKIYFMSNRPLTNAKSLINTWVSEKVNDVWQAPTKLKLPPFNKTIHAVTVAKSGNIYFSGLYKIASTNGEYLSIEKLKPDIIGFHPFIALDESYLIFNRNSDLYIIYSKTDGTWTQPIKLNNRINTPSQEGNAFVTPDGKYMFFSRGNDLYWVDAGFIENLRPE